MYPSFQRNSIFIHRVTWEGVKLWLSLHVWQKTYVQRYIFQSPKNLHQQRSVCSWHFPCLLHASITGVQWVKTMFMTCCSLSLKADKPHSWLYQIQPTSPTVEWQPFQSGSTHRGDRLVEESIVYSESSFQVTYGFTLFTMALTLVGPWSSRHPVGWSLVSQYLTNRQEQTCLLLPATVVEKYECTLDI